jgi:hypothetical protein
MGKSIFPKVSRLAERLAYDAQRHSQWHKRMNAHNLNQSGAKIHDKGLKQGDKETACTSTAPHLNTKSYEGVEKLNT